MFGFIFVLWYNIFSTKEGVVGLVLDGKKLAKENEILMYDEVEKLHEKGVFPSLATIIVGDYAPSVTYVNMKVRACARVGIDGRKIEIPSDYTTDQVVAEVEKLNNDKNVYGILIQHPLPKHIDEEKVFNSISPEKDVDGLSVYSKHYSSTAYGIIDLLKHYNIAMQGKHAVVVGRSNIVGKPVAKMLLSENATVTVCHSKTTNLPDLLKIADIIVVCIGKPHYIKKEWLKEGVVIVDAGYNAGNVGDVDPECFELASAYTPVPGGVGPMTISSLMKQTIIEAKLENSLM